MSNQFKVQHSQNKECIHLYGMHYIVFCGRKFGHIGFVLPTPNAAQDNDNGDDNEKTIYMVGCTYCSESRSFNVIYILSIFESTHLLIKLLKMNSITTSYNNQYCVGNMYLLSSFTIMVCQERFIFEEQYDFYYINKLLCIIPHNLT